MQNISEKIEALKAASIAALEADIKKVEFEHTVRLLCPEYDRPKRVAAHAYNNVTSVNYEAKNREEVLLIIQQWRNRYGTFLPINEYRKSCTVLSAYGYAEYTPESIVKSATDAVEVRNHKGSGFDSVGLVFYPVVEGQRIQVQVYMASKLFAGFNGYIIANYDRSGNITTVEKRAPSAFNKASYTIQFSGGGRDVADWRGVFTHEQFMGAMEVQP